MKKKSTATPHYDLAILGAGMAGLCLARQLLLRSDKKILLVDKAAVSSISSARQKVGESTVQLGGYYLSKVLDLEEHLLRQHFLKYNLRFYWKGAGGNPRTFEGYSQSYIRLLSNIAGFQVDRNKLEAELLRLNAEYPNYTLLAPVKNLDVALSQDGPHTIRFTADGKETVATAAWVVDATGRSKFLTRRMGLARKSSIRHGSSFVWVDGLVNTEKLTRLSLDQIRLRKDRHSSGHLPAWLATNHFMGEGFWFWVIPLHGKTSLGLVYDNALFDGAQVATPQKLIDWVCREFPLFAPDLPPRKILDHGFFRDYSYDCAQTIHPNRWAMSGEAGRFSDPLYSPGTDLIALHNTLIIDAMLSKPGEIAAKTALSETLMRSLYEAYLPSYELSYDVLGDQETYVLKYTWELAIYFGFYVFPYINDLFTERRFVLPFLSKFSRLGPLNRDLQVLLSAFYQWKKTEKRPVREPLFFDFMQVSPLKAAESVFYRVGVTPEEGVDVVAQHLSALREFARFIVAHVISRVLRKESLLTNRAFIESIDLKNIRFEPQRWRAQYSKLPEMAEAYEWSFDPGMLHPFRPESRMMNHMTKKMSSMKPSRQKPMAKRMMRAG